MFLVLCVDKTCNLKVKNKGYHIPLVYAPGMVGACPVFKTKEEAIKYGGPNIKPEQIIELKQLDIL